MPHDYSSISYRQFTRLKNGEVALTKSWVVAICLALKLPPLLSSTLMEVSLKKDKVNKKHFNLYRSLLEKTSVFLGYDNWQILFGKYDKKDIILKVLNMNSHGKIQRLNRFILEKNKLIYLRMDLIGLSTSISL